MNEKSKVILVEPIVQAYTVQNTTIPVISAEDVIVVDDAIQASSTPRNNTEASNLLGSDFVDYSAGLPPPDNFSKYAFIVSDLMLSMLLLILFYFIADVRPVVAHIDVAHRPHVSVAEEIV
jgi:hypothetical protein